MVSGWVDGRQPSICRNKYEAARLHAGSRDAVVAPKTVSAPVEGKGNRLSPSGRLFSLHCLVGARRQHRSSRMSTARFSRWPGRFAGMAGGLVFVIGLLVLLGWTLGIAALRSILPGWPPMVPNTAAAFVLGAWGCGLCGRSTP